jgi:hypothetical protein
VSDQRCVIIVIDAIGRMLADNAKRKDTCIELDVVANGAPQSIVFDYVETGHRFEVPWRSLSGVPAFIRRGETLTLHEMFIENARGDLLDLLAGAFE